MGIINVDYIGVVKTTKEGRVIFKKETINKEYQELLGQLKDMVSNPNITVLDMQTHFNSEIRNAPRGYNYCYPYTYSSSYVNGALYPAGYTFEKYQEKILESNNKCATDAALKRKYEQKAIRYIQALCYHKELQHQKLDDNNRMFSTDNIGWTSYEYNINSDIQFQLSTNFGYGMSSYFIVNLTYKGIDILPYSMAVSYYYANMLDIVRYTRMYETKRDSWNIAFDFVTKTSNEAITNPSAFVQKWIINEIQMMMAGLKRFAEHPSVAFKGLLSVKKIDGLITVRNINDFENCDYKIYPHEMEIAKQAEKISGALKFLTNLESLSEILPEVSGYIQSIKDLNVNMLPSFIKKIDDINKEIESRQSLVERLEEKLEELIQFCKPHSDNIIKLKKVREEETGKYVSEDEIREEYYKLHMDYKIKFEKKKEVQEDIDKRKNDIWKRNYFISEIQSCVDKIRETLQLSA